MVKKGLDLILFGDLNELTKDDVKEKMLLVLIKEMHYPRVSLQCRGKETTLIKSILQISSA